MSITSSKRSKPGSLDQTAPDQSSDAGKGNDQQGVTWGPWGAVLTAFIIFLAAQFIAAQVVSIYPALKHWSQAMTISWLGSSVFGQFFYFLIAETLTVLAIVYFIRWRRGSLKAIGLKRPKWVDIPYAFIGMLIYFPAFLIVVTVLMNLIHSFNVNQQQAIGFSTATTGWPLVLVFLSLVVMPPIAEEIMFRGFIYSGLKRKLPKIWAVLFTCALFAAPHLLEGKSGGPLWIAAVDTFILSLTLIWLREKTGRLYASMGLHGLKNLVAFVELFPIIHMHL